MKKKIEKLKLVPWGETRKKIEARPGFKETNEACELEYAIIEALIKERIKYRLTQRELAKKIGIAQSALARFESGAVNPTLPLLQKIAGGLKLVITVRSSP